MRLDSAREPSLLVRKALLAGGTGVFAAPETDEMSTLRPLSSLLICYLVVFSVYLALSAIPTYYLVLPCVFPLMIAFVGSSSMHCQASHSTGYCQSSANPDGQQTVFVFVYFILQTWIVLCFISKRN